MKKILVFFLVCLIPKGVPAHGSATRQLAWGFHAHRIINRMAVFILPPEMMVFYRRHIDYLADHSTDPDKRRFSVEGEAIRHYMDVEHWGVDREISLPVHWDEALARHLEIRLAGKGADTLLIKSDSLVFAGKDTCLIFDQKVAYGHWIHLIRSKIQPWPEKNEWIFPFDSLCSWLGIQPDSVGFESAILTEQVSVHGINPYYLPIHYQRLVYAFRRNDAPAILRLSADLGHYVADAHVPLHATENYNGQLSGQHGIHAFWESRLPELFASEEYDYIVGKARYIRDVPRFAWKTILESHRLSHEVLEVERDLRKKFRKDRVYGYDTRLEQTVRVHSREYSKAYHKALGGMVEQRMQDAVLALGSLWFSAWVDAGQPQLDSLTTPHWTADDLLEMETLNSNFRDGVEIGRSCK